MSDQIVSVAEIQRRARAAFDKGMPLANCPFNWHSSAYTTWCTEYGRLHHQRALTTVAFQQSAGGAANARLASNGQQSRNMAALQGSNQFNAALQQGGQFSKYKGVQQTGVFGLLE